MSTFFCRIDRSPNGIYVLGADRADARVHGLYHRKVYAGSVPELVEALRIELTKMAKERGDFWETETA